MGPKKYGSKMLLLIDNIINPLQLYDDNLLFSGELTSKYSLLTLGGNLLFTTRRNFQGELPINVIQHELEMLLPESAVDLLTKYRKISILSYDKKEGSEYAKIFAIL